MQASPTLNQVADAAVRRPTLWGRHAIAGLWFPADWYDEAGRMRRILQNWQTGASAYRYPQGDLLCLPDQEARDCNGLDGWPLRREGRLLCSAELAPAEVAALPPGDVCLVLGGQVLALRLGDGQVLDPSAWLATSGLGLLDTYDCREALPLIVNLPIEVKSVREVLGDKAPPITPEQMQLMQHLLARQREIAAQPTGSHYANRHGNQAGAHAGSGGNWAPLGGAGKWVAVFVVILIALGLGVLFQNLGSSFSPSGGTNSPSAPSTNLFSIAWLPGLIFLGRFLFGLSRNTQSSWTIGAQQVKPGAKPAAGQGQGQGAAGQGLPERAKGKFGPQRWRDWLARLAITSQLSKLLGRQQAAYVRRMLELFEKGDLDAALRHAIPLGGDAQSLGQAFGTPSMRKDLSLGQRGGPAASISLGEDLDSYLRQLYRKSFERLAREQRIDEALFVLAELLKSHQEALDFLEQHGRFQQAAALALTWDMPAETIVRLHCLAGDWRRAIAVARRDNAFGPAVKMLEAKWPDAAAQLRREWAETLATKGEWLQAVETIWPLKDGREQATDWLLHAESAGGSLAMSALVKRAVLLPDTLASCQAKLLELRDDAERHTDRLVLARGLISHTGDQAPIASLARAVVRAVLQDHALGRGNLSDQDMKKLVTLSGDKLLQTDLPGGSLPSPKLAPLYSRSEPLRCEAPAAGSAALHDVVPLQDGRYLLAMGEAGAQIINAAGKIQFRFTVPAERLVLAHSGQVALALARRGDVWRVSRLDLARREARDLGMTALDHFATEFDGIGWTVCRNRSIQVLDIQQSLQNVLWQVTDLPGPVLDMSSISTIEQFLIDDGRGGMELWRYALPKRRLMGRDAVNPPGRDGEVGMLTLANGVIWAWLEEVAGKDSMDLMLRLPSATLPKRLSLAENYRNLRIYRGNGWLVAAVDAQSVVDLLFLHQQDARPRASLAWPVEDRPSVRMVPSGWLVHDQRGRLFHLHTETSEIKTLTLH